MPIHQLSARRTLPILGKIRLGVRKESQKGNLYPTTVEHFVLEDAPGVKEVYGEDPKHIDIMFPVDDLEQVIPTNFKRYGQGLKDKSGAITSGKLQCIGPGPTLEGQHGIARWREVNSEPPQNEILDRDARTGKCVTRMCFGAGSNELGLPPCVDYAAKKCKQMMQVFCILPKVSFFGVYQIDTSSWMSIHQFHNQLRWVQELNQGKVKLIPFRIFREEEMTRFMEGNVEKTGKQYIMKLGPNEQFLELAGEDVKKRFEIFRGSAANLLLPPVEDLVALPAEDHFPTIDAEKHDQAEQLEHRLATVDSIVADPEIQALFPEYERAIGRKLSDKDRKILVRKKELVDGQTNPNWRGDVVAALKSGIEASQKKAPPQQQAPAQQAAGGEAAAPPPPTDKDGLF